MSVFPTSDWVPPADPIMGVKQAYREDRRECKVNLGVGAYRTSSGKPYVLSSVRGAEALMLEANQDKEYRPIDGEPAFRNAVAKLVLGEELQTNVADCLSVFATLGGTGGLRSGGEYLALGGSKPIYVSSPTWPNHRSVFSRSGLTVEQYPYLDVDSGGLDIAGMLAAFERLDAGSVVVLHTCCHNPTGIDPSPEQWQEILSVVQRRKLLPFFDMAYQGFGESMDNDAYAVRLFVEAGIEVMIAYSFSKNFGLYGERVGALLMLSESAAVADIITKQMKFIIRANFSNPPIHGSRIVTTILESESLRAEWIEELANMRARVIDMRKTLVSGLLAQGYEGDLSALSRQRGLFSYGFLCAEHVNQLRHDYGVYLPPDGRINVAGLTTANVDYVIEAILSVMS